MLRYSLILGLGGTGGLPTSAFLCQEASAFLCQEGNALMGNALVGNALVGNALVGKPPVPP